jgi:PKD repeat protein
MRETRGCTGRFHFEYRIFVLSALMILLVCGWVGIVNATDVTGSMVITEPGEYYLQNDILNSAVTRCIWIQSSDVIFDGNGFTIDGVDTLAAYGIQIYNASQKPQNITIRNLVLTDWGTGIGCRGDSVRIENVHSSSSAYGITLNDANKTRLTANNISFNSYYGVNAENFDDIYVEHNEFSDNAQGGLMLQLGKSHATVVNNVAKNNTYYGIFVGVTDGVVSDNIAVNNRGSGFTIRGSNLLISNNSATFNYQHGLDFLGKDSIIRDNILDDNNRQEGLNSGSGLWIFGDTYKSTNLTITNNSLNRNSGGLEMSGVYDSRIFHNHIENNSFCGLYLKLFYNNTIYDNYFRNEQLWWFETTVGTDNKWNVSKTPGPNIMGGPYIGGNFWESPRTGGDFARFTPDYDGDGFTDSAYSTPKNTYDYLPLKGYYLTSNFSAAPLSGGNPLAVQFTDLTTGPGAYDWKWDFGDGDSTNSTSVNPLHVYLTPGLYSVNLTVTNSYGIDSELKSSFINVNQGNRPPTLSAIGNKSVAEGALLTFTLSGSDPDGQALTYSSTTLPPGATLIGRTFSWTPGYDQAGKYPVTFTVSDGSLTDSESIMITVTDANRAPELAAIGDKTVAEGTALTFTLAGSDPDGQILTYSSSTLPPGATLTGSSFSWTPGYDQAGPYPVTFTVSDGSLTDSKSITVTVTDVNRAPELAAIGDKTVAEGTALTFTLAGSDPDGQILTYSSSTLPPGATLTGSSFSWTPGYDQAGSYPVMFTVSDDSLTDSESITINVTDVNSAPVFDLIGNRIIDEGQELSFTLSASDSDGDALSYTTSILPSGASFDPGTRTFSWCPDFDAAGAYSVTFTVSDGKLTDIEEVGITVNNVNHVPIAEAGPDQQLSLIGSTVFLNGDQSYDEDGDNLNYQWTIISKPADSSAILNGASTVNPTFKADKYGAYTVQLIVNDGTDSSIPDFITCTFENVKPVADAGVSQSIILGEGVTLDGSHSSDVNEDPLTFQWSLVSVPEGSIAQITNPTNAQTTIVPDKVGTYSIQLVVNDGSIDSDPSSIEIEVVVRESQIITDIQNIENYISTIPVDLLKNTNMQNSLNNKLNAVIADVSDGDYNGAINKLQNDILAKTDGCAVSGSPDKNDWITDCSVQTVIYPQIISIINKIGSL